MKPYIIILFVVLLLLQSAVALPDSQTSVSGQTCQRGHTLRYSYTVNAPKEVTVGDSFTVSLDFLATMDSKLRRAPTDISATLSGSNVETTGNMMQKCPMNSGASWDLVATAAGTAKLEFATKFSIDGNDAAHRGYSATYSDVVAFSIVVKEKPVPPSVVVENMTTPEEPVDVPVVVEDNSTVLLEPVLNQSNTITDSGKQDNVQVIVEEFEVAIEPDPEETSWLMTRFLGLLAYLLLFLSVLTALLKKSQYAPKLTMMFKYHHDVSLLALLIALFHGLSNIFDKYLWDLSVTDVFLPRFGTQTQLLITGGIIAFYVMLIVVATSFSPKVMRRIGIKHWKYVHMSSYIGFIAVFVHSILLGSDLQSGPLLYVFWGAGLLILIITIDVIVKKVLER